MNPRRVRLKEAQAIYDGLPAEGRAVAADYGLGRALAAYQTTGAWPLARGLLSGLFGDPLRARAPSVGSGANPEAAP